MTPEEKIETLRRWAKRDRTYWSFEKTAGYTDAQRQVRDIIDPPKPKWREAVDEKFGWAAGTPSPLGSTLRELADLEYGKVDSYADPTTLCLARIVAVAEAQVGDGWQADPDDWPDSWDDPVDVWSLLDALCDTEDKWQSIGDRAAAWLRSLTDGGAA